MKNFHAFGRMTQRSNALFVWSLLRRLLLALLLAGPIVPGVAAEQSTFATPEEAVDALVAGLAADDDAAIVALYGEQYKWVVVTPDREENSARRARILDAIKTYHVLEAPNEDTRILVIGDQAWPLPIPIVRSAGRWRFATEQGVEEIKNRRIGANERNAIYVLNAYLNAQREYASRDRDGSGVLQYAHRLLSSPGKHDGLYWPADPAAGEEESPFGPMIAESSARLSGRTTGEPYRGYHFSILTAQGKHAPGGAYSYIINGRMIAGFAMIAYPAAFDETGVMTFIVNHNGKIYQRDLGPKTAEIAPKITTFDPAPGWEAVTP